MRRSIGRLSSCVLLGLTLAQAVWAQWPPRLPRDTPLTPEGTPDVDAPAPRTADGNPDLSGVWRGVEFGAGRQPPLTFSEGPPVASFLNVAQNVPDGLPLRPAAAALFDERRAGNGKDNPEAHCLPMGIMQFQTQGMPRKLIQMPELIVILYEASMGLRQIFMDGRPLPDDDSQPWWYGYSVGRWEDDTLVVETSGLRDDGWLDVFGTPLTDAARLTERFRRVSYGRMEIDITVDDPKAYSSPWTVRVNQRLMPGEELIEFVCLENQRFTPR